VRKINIALSKIGIFSIRELGKFFFYLPLLAIRKHQSTVSYELANMNYNL